MGNLNLKTKNDAEEIYTLYRCFHSHIADRCRDRAAERLDLMCKR